MKIIRSLFLTLMLLGACSSSKYVVPSPVNGGNSGNSQQGTGTGDETGTGTDTDPVIDPEEAPEGALWADGNDEGTYDLILEKGYNLEPPDNSGEHASSPFRHIRQSWDATLKKYVFDFIIHIKNDDDRGLANVTDRQRNEIKTDGKSPEGLVAKTEGETLRMSWKFQLPAGMKTTTKFCHVHQLKGIDNKEGTADVSLPAITFTCRSLSSGKQQLQVIHVGRTEDNTGNVYLGKADLADFLGEWVSVVETVKFAKDGTYQLQMVRMRDGKKLMSIDRKGIDMWRTGTTGMRPKWGIYRSFGEGRSLEGQLRDETLHFADFCIEKL